MRRIGIDGFDLKALQRVLEPSAVRGESLLTSSGPCEVTRSHVMIQLRGRRRSWAKLTGRNGNDASAR